MHFKIAHGLKPGEFIFVAYIDDVNKQILMRVSKSLLAVREPRRAHSKLMASENDARVRRQERAGVVVCRCKR